MNTWSKSTFEYPNERNSQVVEKSFTSSFLKVLALGEAHETALLLSKPCKGCTALRPNETSQNQDKCTYKSAHFRVFLIKWSKSHIETG